MNDYQGSFCCICNPNTPEVEEIIDNLLFSFRQMLLHPNARTFQNAFPFGVIQPKHFFDKIFNLEIKKSKPTQICSHQFIINTFVKELSINGKQLTYLCNVKNSQRAKQHFHLEIVSKQVKQFSRLFPCPAPTNRNTNQQLEIQMNQNSMSPPSLQTVSLKKKYEELIKQQPNLEPNQMINQADQYRFQEDFPPPVYYDCYYGPPFFSQYLPNQIYGYGSEIQPFSPNRAHYGSGTQLPYQGQFHNWDNSPPKPQKEIKKEQIAKDGNKKKEQCKKKKEQFSEKQQMAKKEQFSEE